jgi:hypothetical protein
MMSKMISPKNGFKGNASNAFRPFLGKYFGKIFLPKKRLENPPKVNRIRHLCLPERSLLQVPARGVMHQD